MKTTSDHLKDMLNDPGCRGEMTGIQVEEVEKLIAFLEKSPMNRLKELAELIPKDEHQPMFVKYDAVEMFDQWNDTAGAIPKGTSWYYEAKAVVESIAAMAFGAGIFYQAERAERKLKEVSDHGESRM